MCVLTSPPADSDLCQRWRISVSRVEPTCWCFFKTPKWCWCTRVLGLEFRGMSDFSASKPTRLGAGPSLHLWDLLGGWFSEMFFEHRGGRHLGWHLGVLKFKGNRMAWEIYRSQSGRVHSLWLRMEQIGICLRGFLLALLIPSGFPNDCVETELIFSKHPSVHPIKQTHAHVQIEWPSSMCQALRVLRVIHKFFQLIL